MQKIPALLPVLMLAACVSGGDAPDEPAAGDALPRLATYSCEDGTSLRVENRGTSVSVDRGEGEPVDLPASPADSRNRYGAALYALVLDGSEALWMKSGDPPATCRR